MMGHALEQGCLSVLESLTAAHCVIQHTVLFASSLFSFAILCSWFVVRLTLIFLYLKMSIVTIVVLHC